jgi:tripartite-type tricarboxylate transporter receptor subunit TctC
MALMVIVLGAPTISTAQDSYPAKSVRIVVPAAPGGTSDILARVAAEHLDRGLGQRFIVENRSGGAGITGVDGVAKAPPDGYTFVLIQTGVMVIDPFIFKNLPFDPLTDLIPVAPIADQPQVIAVPAQLPVANLSEFVSLARRHPAKLNYGSAGPGTTSHLVGELFAQGAKIELVHVPYRGAGPAVIDLAAGHVQVVFLGFPTVQSLIDSGTVRPLAVTQKTRLPSMPEVPTVDETVVPGFETSTWFGLLAPRGTPGPVITTINRQIGAMLDSSAVRERFTKIGLVPLKEAPDAFAARIARDYEKYRDLLKTVPLKIE